MILLRHWPIVRGIVRRHAIPLRPVGVHVREEITEYSETE